jgi:tripartite-type tricarboxylate transporter receptor subunit TctC
MNSACYLPLQGDIAMTRSFLRQGAPSRSNWHWGHKGFLGLAALFAVASAFAAFPDKPIRLIVAFPPGSSTDIVARIVGQKMSLSLGQPVVIENRPGASGNIATNFVTKQAADGYTLLIHSVAVAINPALYSKAGYDVNKDLEAVAMAAIAPNIIYVHPDVKAKSLSELAALSKKEKLSYASSGNGTTTQLGAELLFKTLMKVDIQHIPFAPAAAANAVMSGQVPVGSTSIPPVVQLAKAGKVRPLAVTSRKRSSALPDVPTVEELGYKGFEANTWFALFAPAGTPTEALDFLNREINKTLLYSSITESFGAQSLETARMDRPTLKAYVALEATKWGKVAKSIGAQVD